MLRSEGFRKYFRNTSWLFLERMVRLVVVLVTGIYVARYLGDSLFGQLNYATGFVGLFFALTTMGLDEIVVRDLVKHPQRRDELLGTSAVIKRNDRSASEIASSPPCSWSCSSLPPPC